MHSKTSVLLLVIWAAVQFCDAKILSRSAKIQFSEIQLNGTCPKIRFVNNLDFPRVVGWYFRPLSNLNNSLCYNNDAQTMFAAGTEGGISVVFCCRSASDPDVTTCGENVGSGSISSLDRPGEFEYRNKDQVYPNFVLDTDYDNFTIVYGCKPEAGGNQRDEIIFVYSRTYSLRQSILTRVQRVLESNGIEWSRVKRVKQGSDMPYLPLPKLFIL